MAVTNAKIARLARALFPRYGIQDIPSLVATISKYKSRDGHVSISRPDGGWSWLASPGSTAATPNRVTLAFRADYRRDARSAREDLYRKLEDATLEVMSEDELEAAMARTGGRVHERKALAFTVETEMEDASGPTGRWEITDRVATQAEADKIIAWRKGRGANARRGRRAHFHEKKSTGAGTKSAAQIDRELDQWLRENREKYARERRRRSIRRYGGHRPFGPRDI